MLHCPLHFVSHTVGRICVPEPKGKLPCATLFQHRSEYKLILSVVLLSPEIRQWHGLEAEAVNARLVHCCQGA